MRSLYFIIIVLGYLLACFYVVARGWLALPPLRWVRIGYALLALYLVCGYMVVMAFHKHIPLGLGKVMEYVGSTWLIALVYLLMAVLAIDVACLLDRWLHFLPAFGGSVALRLRQYVALSVLGLTAVLFAAGYFRFTHPKTVAVDIPAYTAMTIVFASDLHLGSMLGRKSAQRFVDKINAQHPDVILLGGDVINADLRPLRAQRVDKVLQQLYAPLGVYAVLGNHEYIGGDPDASAAFLESAGIRVLRDTVTEVYGGKGAVCLQLIGRDDRSNRQRIPLATLRAMLPLRDSVPTVLLDHQPYQFDEVREQGITLTLSGHTHRGQVWPVSWVVDRMFEVSHGYMQKDGSHLYVSSGLGIWGPPFRIGTQSEVVAVRLYNARPIRR